MDKKKQPTFQNHWLNMQVSIEENLKYYRRQRTGSSSATSVFSSPGRNEWLNCGERSDQVLHLLTLNSDNLVYQVETLRGLGLASQRAQRLVGRFHALKQSVAHGANGVPPGLQAEYTLLSEQVMPTLARINKRLAARQQMLGDSASHQAAPVAADTLDVALRAVLKRRG